MGARIRAARRYLKALGTAIPIYVTRPNSDGQIAEYSQSIWMTLLAQLVVWLNVVLWGAVGIITAIGALS